MYGSPIAPFASHTSGAPLTVREEVNTSAMNDGYFDTVVDLAAAVADPANPQQLL